MPQRVQAVFGATCSAGVGGCSVLPWGRAVPLGDIEPSAGDAVPCRVPTSGGVQCNAPEGSTRRVVLCSPVEGASWVPQCCAARSHPEEGVPGAGGEAAQVGGPRAGRAACEGLASLQRSAGSRGAGGAWAQGC